MKNIKIIEVNGKGYHVIEEYIDKPKDFIDRISSHYESLCSDFFILKGREKNEYLMCRAIIDVELSEED